MSKDVSDSAIALQTAIEPSALREGLLKSDLAVDRKAMQGTQTAELSILTINGVADTKPAHISNPDLATDRSKGLPELHLGTDASDLSDRVAANDSKKGLMEANSFLLKAAEEKVNQSVYKLPGYIHGLPKPSPDLGCVSSFSNRYREALHLAGIIDKVDDKAFLNLYQVNMTDLNKAMGVGSQNPEAQLLKPISKDEAKEGDVIECIDPDTTKRHMGIVGGIENGKRMVYDNYGGIFRKEPLDLRFASYPEEQRHYYRPYLPPKASN